MEDKKAPVESKPEPAKDPEDFKNSLAALIGRGRPGTIKKAKVEEAPKPVEQKKVNIFDDEEEKQSSAFISQQKPNIQRRKRGTIAVKK